MRFRTYRLTGKIIKYGILGRVLCGAKTGYISEKEIYIQLTALTSLCSNKK
jgi:hypothetical protein